jgi:TATA-box binding protein (TBP) (component of TFIID and TFIIIB)
LLFRSGKMNIVGAKTIEHARCNAQFIRLYLESVEAPYLVDNRRIVLSDACGRLQFERFCVHLFVVSANLPVRPNLQVLQAHAPEISSWDPENFPGLKLRVWLRPRDKCACVRKKGRQGCACTATVILFDTGKFNVTGTKSVADINQTVQLVRDLFSDTRLCAVGAQLPAKMRYDQRLASILSSIDFCGQTRRSAPAAAKTTTTGIFQYITTTTTIEPQQHGLAPSMLANFLSSLSS